MVLYLFVWFSFCLFVMLDNVLACFACLFVVFFLLLFFFNLLYFCFNSFDLFSEIYFICLFVINVLFD